MRGFLTIASVWPPFLLLLTPLALAQDSQAVLTAHQTLWQQSAFSLQKPCATRCFVTDSGCTGEGDLLADALGCSANLICPTKDFGTPNKCYCRGDNQAPASSYLASCIKSACSIGDPAVDISIAVGLYSSYCSSNGLLPTTAAFTTTPTPIDNSGTKQTETVPTSSSPASSVPGSKSGTSSPTSRASNVSPFSQSTARTSSSSSPAGENSGESKGGGLSTSDKIGLGVGLAAVFLAVPGCILAIRSLRRRRAIENPP